MRISINNLLSYLYLVIPVLLISGPFLPDLSLVIISLFFFYNLKDIKNSNIIIKKFLIIFAIFYFLICLSSFISEYNFYSLKSSLPYLRFCFFSLSVYFLFKNHENISILLLRIFIFIILLLLVDSVLQYLSGYNIFGWPSEQWRVSSFFGEDEILGSYVARLFPFIISLFFFLKQKLKIKINNNIFLFILISSCLITFISGERTSFFLMLLSILMVFFICKELRKLMLGSFIVIIMMFTSLILFNDKTRTRMLNQTISQLGLKSNSERMILFSPIYESHYTIALKMFKEKPFFGHGPKTFRKYCAEPENYLKPGACTTHPHNILMQFMAEIGIVGTIIYIGLYFFLILKLLNLIKLSFLSKEKNEKNYLTMIYIFYFVNLFPLAPSGNFFNNWLSIIYYLPLGYMLFLLDEIKTTK